MYHSSKDHHFASRRQKFIIFAQSSIISKPRIGSLHHPALRNHFKAWLVISPIEVFQLQRIQLDATLGTATATPGVTGQEITFSVPYTITAADTSDTITVGMQVQTVPTGSSATNSDTYWTTQYTSSK
jgi:hypothetical protein